MKEDRSARISDGSGEDKKGKASDRLAKLITVAAVLILLAAGSVLVSYFADIAGARRGQRNLADLTRTEETAPPETRTQEPTETDTRTQLEELPKNVVFPQGLQEKYKKAYAVNSDLVGWLRVPNTKIDHPVVQGPNNDYYLRKDFYSKKYARRGAIFMDYRNHVVPLPESFDANTIIFGHNFLDSTMMSDLEKYKSIEFWKKNPVIEFNTIYSDCRWKVIAVFLTNALEKDDNGYVFNYIYPFMQGENYAGYFDALAQRSLYSTGVDVGTSDKILTLSTCTRDMDIGRRRTNARCVVVARLVRPGESEAVDTSLAGVNPQPRYPQIWYDKHKKTNPYEAAERWYPKGAVF